jgi:hypothetical protein
LRDKASGLLPPKGRKESTSFWGYWITRGGFFYIANVPQDILQKFFGEEIKVEGKVHRERGEKTNPK